MRLTALYLGILIRLMLIIFLYLAVVSTCIGQAPTNKINGYWCRDSIAENKVIELRNKSIQKDTVIVKCLNSIDIKNQMIDNLLIQVEQQTELFVLEKDKIKSDHKEKIKRKNKRAALSVIINAVLLGLLIL